MWKELETHAEWSKTQKSKYINHLYLESKKKMYKSTYLQNKSHRYRKETYGYQGISVG